MNQNNQDFKEQNVRPYYPLSNISEAQLSIEQEYFNPNRSNNRSHSSTTEIITALGFVTALLCFAGLQLHRSVNVNTKAKNQTEKALIMNTLEGQRKITPKKFVWRIEEKAIDESMEQSLIDWSKF